MVYLELIIASLAVLIDAMINSFFNGNSYGKLGNWLMHRSLALAGVAYATASWIPNIGKNDGPMYFIWFFFAFTVVLEYAASKDRAFNEHQLPTLGGICVVLLFNSPGLATLLGSIAYAKGLAI